MKKVLKFIWIYVFLISIPYIVFISSSSLLIKGVMIYGNFMAWLLPTLVFKWENKLLAKGWKLRYFNNVRVIKIKG